ncbi:MAG: ABC transporter substrate-binding protein [Chloroflexi bacterium]|nr:ABC transporter substrate-binding protein [Chloroflexota bacterium]
MLKKLTLLTVLLIAISALGFVSSQGMYNEAPALAEMVAAGELPPVDERLPAEPLVIEPVEEIGQYGGTWRLVDNNDSNGWTQMTVNVEGLLKWNRDVNGFRPNIVTSWEWNDEATELTVNFRQGIKWSDGDPMTVDDYLFWWNDMVLDENVPVNAPFGTTVRGKLMSVEKIDDYTLHFSFPHANPLFLEYKSRGAYHSSIHIVPEHYMRGFHPAYSDAEDATELVNRYNFGSRMHYPDRPTLSAWMTVDYVPSQRLVLDRNPYYWKVDTEGNQLPYIDRLDVEIPQGSAAELVALKGIAGELDMQVRDVNLLDVPLVLENQEAGDYRVIMWSRGDYAWPWIIPMYDYPDEGILDLMYMKEFRQAMSHAINRDRINEITSLGLATARQFSLSAESPEFQTPEGQEFYQKWAASYASYDPELAGSLLDGIGVVDADGDGWRDRPDGTALELIVDIPAADTGSIDRMDLIKEDWEAVGLKTVLNIIAWELVSARHLAGEIMIRAWGSAAAWGLVSAATVWTPIEGVTYSVGGARIGDYYNSGGERGVAPRPGSMLEQLQDAYTELISIVDPVEREARLLEAYQIHIDEGPITIGTIGEHPSPVIVKNNFRNVQDFGLVAGWDLAFPGTADPEQFFFDQDG